MAETKLLNFQDEYDLHILDPCIRCCQGNLFRRYLHLKPWPSSLRRRKWILMGTVGGVATLIVVGIIVYYTAFSSDKDDNPLDPPDVTEKPLPSDSAFGNYRQAAVVANGYLCADIGKDVLLEGGTAVDSAIATLVCEGVMALQSMGIGGGFLMTIYNRSTETAEVLNARETAPAAATEDMYNGNPTLSEIGGLSVAVPGELRGYEAAWIRYGGKVSWKRLFEPTIKICKEGFKVFPYLARILKSNEAVIRKSPSLSEILINPETDQILQEGDLLKRPRLAETLQIIAEKGADAFYDGELSDTIVDEIQADGGILTREDLRNYNVQWQQPVECDIGPYHMYSVPLPGSGVLVNFILNILDENFVKNVTEEVLYQRIVEAFKYGYGKRTELGDISDHRFVPNYDYVEEVVHNLTSRSYADEIRKLIEDNKTYQDPKHYGAVFSIPEDHGTAHLNVLAPNGDAVSVTSTVNLLLGSKFRSRKLGIIWNNEMNDFSIPNVTNAFGVPPSPTNFIKPGKRPMSSMCPSIFINKNKDAQLVTGGAGGTRITTSTILVALNNLIFNKNIKESIDERRFHHQLAPMAIDYEYGFLAQDIKFLQDIGHKTARLPNPASFVTGIARWRNNVTATYDFRRFGSVAGF